jgi:hypothetical protein
MRDLESPPAPWTIGVDLAARLDFTAILVIEAIAPRPFRYDVRRIERWRPLRYAEVIDRLVTIARTLRAPVRVWTDGEPEIVRPDVAIVVDRTGVGEDQAHYMSDADLAGADLSFVLIHGGDATGRDGNTWRVPKRDLVEVPRQLLEQGRLRFPQDDPLTATLVHEFDNFRARINPRTRHESYGAGSEWRENEHDDCLLAGAIGLWHAERTTGGEFQELPAETFAALSRWAEGE